MADVVGSLLGESDGSSLGRLDGTADTVGSSLGRLDGLMLILGPIEGTALGNFEGA